MTNLTILYIGKNPEITETVIRLINNRENWQGVAANTADEARELFATTHFNVVLLGNGIGPDEEAILFEFFNETKPEVPVIQHYGGGSGLLYAEIAEAISGKKK